MTTTEKHNAAHRPYFRPTSLDNTLHQALCPAHAQALYLALLHAYKADAVRDESSPFVSTFVDLGDALLAEPQGTLPAWLYPWESGAQDWHCTPDDCPECWHAHAVATDDTHTMTHRVGWRSLGMDV